MRAWLLMLLVALPAAAAADMADAFSSGATDNGDAVPDTGPQRLADEPRSAPALAPEAAATAPAPHTHGSGHAQGRIDATEAALAGIPAFWKHEPALVQPQQHDWDPVWQPAQDNHFGVRFKCPLHEAGGGTGQEIIDNSVCPYYLLDQHDIMSQPDLVVDPVRSDWFAFHAMHGGQGIHVPEPLGNGVPSSGARDNDVHQPHTVWRTSDQPSWWDHPYYAPEQFTEDDRTIFGIDNAITMDSFGHMYTAAAYAYRDADDPDWRYAVILYKLDRINVEPAYTEPYIIRLPGNSSLDRLDIVHIPDTEQIVVSWLQHSDGSDIGPESFMNFWWTGTENNAPRWQELPVTERVGPCRDVTNSLGQKHLLYFGCYPEEGFFGFNGSVDQLQMFHVEFTEHPRPEYLDAAPVTGGKTLLVSMSDEGHQLLVASGVDGNDKPFVTLVYGAVGDIWWEIQNIGEDIRESGRDGVEVAEARINAAAYTRESGYIHLIYMERYDVDETALEGGQQPSMHKTYAVVRAFGQYQGEFDLNYGESPIPVFFADVYRGGPGNDQIFNDQHDSIVVWKDPDSDRERVFTAFGDHGFVRMAEAVEENPHLPIGLPTIPVPAIPLAAPAATGNAASAAAGVIFGLMLMRMLAARKKLTFKAPA